MSHQRGKAYRFAADALEQRLPLSSVRYVDVNAPGPTHNGASWANAYVDLQQALAVAVSGDQIRVADGTYTPTSTTDRSISFQLKSGVEMDGGFAGYGAADPDERIIATHATFLAGSISGGTSGVGNSYHVVNGSGTNAATVLDGFTITAGYADGGGLISGAGMYISDGRPTIRNCTFSQNKAFGSGAAIFDEAASAPVIINCDFLDDTANASGGGIYNLNSSLTLTNCGFSGEYTVVFSGGGLVNDASTATVTNCVFDFCRTTEDGGAMVNANSTVAITNCLFVNNNAGGKGAGIANSGGNTTVTNCTFTANGLPDYTDAGGAIYNGPGASLTATNCIFWNDSAITSPEILNDAGSVAVTYSDVQGGFGGTGNILTDPQFISSTNQRVKLTSPCIDVGNNAAVPMGVIQDLSGANRFINIPGVHDPGLIVDMGAYERVPGTLSINNKTFAVAAVKPSLKFVFNGNISSDSLQIDDLLLHNLTTDQMLVPSRWGTFTYDSRAMEATWTFTAPLPDGNYRAALPADSMTDPFGYPLGTDETYDFFALAGDANRDRVVDVTDLGILATNWQGNGNFSQADFNYDGHIDVSDLGILATNWQKSLPAASSSFAIEGPVFPLRKTSGISRSVDDVINPPPPLLE